MLPIQKLFINYNYSPRNAKIEYIVIHDVGAVSTAKNNREYFNSANRNASADFFIDSKNIIQLLDYVKNNSWAVGDGKGQYGITNKNSISIEMCLEPNFKISATTMQNTIELVRFLMQELNIPLAKVVRHYDASRKTCPKSFSDKDWTLWHEFKKQLIPPSAPPKALKVNYVLEYQKWYNKVTQTAKPILEDGVYGAQTLQALNVMELLIKGGK